MKNSMKLIDILPFVTCWVCIRVVGNLEYIIQGYPSDICDGLLQRNVGSVYAIRDRLHIVLL